MVHTATGKSKGGRVWSWPPEAALPRGGGMVTHFLRQSKYGQATLPAVPTNSLCRLIVDVRIVVRALSSASLRTNESAERCMHAELARTDGRSRDTAGGSASVRSVAGRR